VLILTSFLGARYAAEQPLSLSASLVFEQSYGGVDGDSASLAELSLLLATLADVPIRQSLAVTGSVNQHGDVQAIGGVNEKIEGFFDICAARGLNGEQGVIIPAANIQHLMLREDVVEAVNAGEFHVYAVERVDEALELLTGMPAGEMDEDGNFPAETVNEKVNARLESFTDKQKSFGDSSDDEEDGEENDKENDEQEDEGDDEKTTDQNGTEPAQQQTDGARYDPRHSSA
jgi:predicted ATP-dependent protease